jgi:pimeloyl-ACP methyl ester carboxylesterase
MEQPDRWVSVNGVRLAVDDRNPSSDATPLVLVHGFTGGRVDFADVIDTLAADRRVVAWDHRGHADSTNTGDAATYTFDQLVDDMAAAVDEIGLEQFHLLGHSMGGIVAQRYVLAHPERVASLVLMDTGGQAMKGIPSEWIDGTVTRGRAEGMAAVADFMAGFAEDAFTGPADAKAQVIGRLRHKLSNMDVEAFDALGHALGEFPSMLERLGAEVKVPVTVLVGENDIGLIPAAHALHDAIPGSELVVIPDAAHSPQDENPPAWLDAIHAHLARAEA